MKKIKHCRFPLNVALVLLLTGLATSALQSLRMKQAFIR